jgi:hypothetical protein
MPNTIEIPPGLRKAIESNDLIIFAGAGVSLSLGVPNWKDLVIRIIEGLEANSLLPFKELLINNVLNPLDVLNFLEKDYKNSIFELLDDSVGSLRDEPKVHKKLIKLSSKVITTNYDIGFDEAWKQEFNGYANNIVEKDQNYNLSKLYSKENFIFKIHGSISDPGSCVLFENQYRELYKDENAFLLELKFLFLRNTILFVGFSLEDPYVNKIINKINNLYDNFTRKHYIITTDQKLHLPDNVVRVLLNNYDQLDDCIDQLITLKPTISNLPSRPYTELIGRENAIQAVFELIAKTKQTILIKGVSGIGKSGMALEIGHLCTGKNVKSKFTNIPSFECVIWVNAKDVEQDLSLLYVTIEKIINYGKRSQIIQRNPQQRAKDIEALLKDHKALIIIDSFEKITNADIINWLKVSYFPSVIMITSTKPVIDECLKYELNGISQEDTIKFLEKELGNNNRDLQDLIRPESKLIIAELSQNIRNLQLAAGQIRLGNINFNEWPTIPGLQAYFYRLAWDKLSDISKEVVQYFAIFDKVSTIRKTTLQKISGYDDIEFLKATVELSSTAFINYIYTEDAYSILQSSVDFIKKQISIVEQIRLRKKWANFYNSFMQLNILRQMPNEQYWNALVSNNMSLLKDEWQNINEISNWLISVGEEEEQLLFLNFTLMLVHYMDSRFYNEDRLLYVRRAIECSKNLGKEYEEALLRIDALGWTYIEESKFDLAKKEIQQGLKIARILKNFDLIALGNAWKARIMLLEGYPQDASALIGEELPLKVKPWIAYRVSMIKGDVKRYLNKPEDALQCYQNAIVHFNEYGSEGNSYQINPRIGFAYIDKYKLDKDVENLNNAEQMFQSVIEGNLPIGNLYIEFGLAMISYYRGNITSKDAKDKITFIKNQLTSKGSTNVLIRLIDDFEITLTANPSLNSSVFVKSKLDDGINF